MAVTTGQLTRQKYHWGTIINDVMQIGNMGNFVTEEHDREGQGDEKTKICVTKDMNDPLIVRFKKKVSRFFTRCQFGLYLNVIDFFNGAAKLVM